MDSNIQDLPQLLTGYFGEAPKIVKQTISRLTKDGEHYGSVMLKLDLEIENEDKSISIFHAVAKKLPIDPLAQEAFNIQVTFKKEIAFYETILLALHDFQREEGITDILNCFPEFYGARLGLSLQNEKVDIEHAVILMENLKEIGYVNVERQVGFDLNGAEVVLRDLAKFHGVPLGMKIKNPEEFERKLKVHCHDYTPYAPLVLELNEIVKDVLMEDAECAKLLPKILLWGTKHFTQPREPFAGICHDDLWLSNTMQLHKDGKVVKNKIIDFQFFTYRSVVADVLFLIFTSVQDTVISEHLDRLLKYYHFHLLETLRECNCPTNAFQYEHFMKELKIEVDYEIGHALQFILFVVNVNRYAYDKEKTQNIEDISRLVKTKERAWFIIKECHKKGWL